MNKALIIKDTVLVAVSVAGSFLARTLGGWDTALQTLIILMAIDYISGLLIAGVWQKSSKSQTGALESRAGFKGLVRKGLILLVVLIGVQLDAILGLQAFCRTAISCSSAEMKDCRLWRTWVLWACLCRILSR